MDDVIKTIESFFASGEIALDETGCLSSVAELLEFAHPALLFLAEINGQVIAANSLGSEVAPETAGDLAQELSVGLADDAWRVVPKELGSWRGNAFGTRLDEAAPLLLGGLLRLPADGVDRFRTLLPALRVCGKISASAIRTSQEMRRAQTQITHLVREQHTLKSAHTEAIARALEEHEQRQREEQERLAMEKMCQATEAANRAKSQFLANMSHEIRTPLNAILGFTELLRRGADNGNEAERQEYLSIVEASGRHLLTLINDILDISKIEAGHMTFERIPCSPHRMVAQVTSLLRVRAQEKHLSFECQWVGGIPATIQSDPIRIMQLLVNLAGNAIKFTRQGGVRIVTRLAGTPERPQLAFEVIDTGAGIAPDKLESVFDAFVQADSSVTRQFGGTGLGLSISRRIAESLGGSLTVRSELGKGSTFTATIDTGPLDSVDILESPPADGVADESPERPPQQIVLPGTRVLLVEDGETNRKLIDLILTRAGAQVATAENGEVGVRQALRSPFDVILMDMQMPVMDGYSATRRLRRAGVELPIIALTAHAMAQDEDKCLRAGCSAYLTKPIDSDRLLETVARCVEHMRRPRAKEDVVTRGTGCAAPSPPSAAPLISTLPTADPDFREIVEEFVEQLGEKLDSMRTAWRTQDLQTLAGLAHWLKGSGGTAGFAAFTEPARLLEQLAKEQRLDLIAASLNTVESLFARIVVTA